MIFRSVLWFLDRRRRHTSVFDQFKISGDANDRATHSKIADYFK